MKRLLVVLLLLCAGACYAGQSVSYGTQKVCGIIVNVVTANLSGTGVKVVPAMADGFCYERSYVDESFTSMMGRFKPTAAINGTFFDKYTLKPVGSVVFDGKLIHSGGIGTAFCVKTDGSIEFKRVSGTDGRRVDWSGVSFAFCSGPTLLIDGKNVVDPKSEGFRDPHVYARANRSALGMTAAKKLLLVTMPGGATLSDEASVMKALGAVNAINLDGGASSALYYKGQYVTKAGRELTNVLLVYEDGKYPREKMNWKDVWTVLGTSPNVPVKGGTAVSPKPAIPVSPKIDIKPYPGAKSEPVMSMDEQWYVLSKTSDTFEKVVAHYRKEIGSKGKLEVVSQNGMKGAYCIFDRQSGVTMVSIAEENENGERVTTIAVMGRE